MGEYEPLAFEIHALDDLGEVGIEVSDLSGGRASVIPRDHADVRLVRNVRVLVDAKARTYRMEPFLLEKRPALSLSKGESAAVWLTIKIPDAAKAGEYRGTITVRATGREAARLKLSVQVLPFSLPPAPVEMAMFAPRLPDDDAMLRRQLVDAREHGLTGFEPGLQVVIKSRDRRYGEDDVAATIEGCRRVMRAAEEVFGRRRFPLTLEVGHQIAFYWDQGLNWFAFWPHDKSIETDFLKAIQTVADVAKAEGRPPLRVYAVDEAGAHNLLDEAVYYYRFIKERLPGLHTWTTIGGGMAMGLDEIGPLSPWIDFFSTNRFTPEIARALVERGKPYGIYNGCGATAAGARFFFGFYGWKTGAQQIAQWAYHFGDAVFAGNGIRREDEGYVYMAPDGPTPSVMWEAVREGIDDYRYIHRLSQMVAAARASSQPGARTAADDAAKTLAGLLGRIGWHFQALDSAERTPPPPAAALRKWRWKVAQQVIHLQQILGDDVRLPPAVARVSPLDHAWSAPEPEEVTFGDEQLPNGGFESALKPWRIEAWKGPGKGELDSNERRGGKQSVRIEIPGGSGSDVVTVLVWPKWGDGGLNLVLDRDGTYEFSAWVKLSGRRTPPMLRIALPDGTMRRSRSGRDTATADGWQRIWLRVEMESRGEPNYVAVWVQGPGTVWVDDLSLREVSGPPLSISLDQAEYDNMDKAAVATIAVAHRITPAGVRFVLTSIQDETVAKLTAPFEADARLASTPFGRKGSLTVVAPVDLRTCRFVFDPSLLEPGRYEATVELLDRQGNRLATKTITLQRSDDW